MNDLGSILKAQFLMGSGGAVGGGNNMLWGLIVLTIVEFLTGIFKEISTWAKKCIDDYLKSKLQKAVTITTSITGVRPIHELIFERVFKAAGNWDKADAIIAQVVKIPESRSFIIVSNNEIVRSDTPFLMTKGIYFKLITLNIDTDGTIKNVSFKLYSDTLDVCEIREYVNTLVELYLIDKKNNLGDKLYYFDHIVEKKGPRDAPSRKLSFTRHIFESNRNLDNVYHERGEELRTRVKFFIEHKEWYNQRGIPHTLGLMLYGPPGTGKTSCVKAVANEAKRHIVNINLGAVRTKKQLKKLFYDERLEVCDNIDTPHQTTEYIIPVNKRLYLIEDIDCIDNDMLLKRDREQTHTLINPHDRYAQDIMQSEAADIPDLDLATILNIIDGTLETPGRILIITTNYPEKLDDAFIRPGRIDLLLEYKNCNHKMIRDMFMSFYEVEPDPALIASIKEYEWSPAETGQILFRCFGKPEEALRILAEGKKVLFAEKAKAPAEQTSTITLQPQAEPVQPVQEEPPAVNEEDDDAVTDVPVQPGSDPFSRTVEESEIEEIRARLNIPTEVYTLSTGGGVPVPDSPYMTGWSEAEPSKTDTDKSTGTVVRRYFPGGVEDTPINSVTHEDPAVIAARETTVIRRLGKMDPHILENGYKEAHNGYAMPFS